MIRLHHTGFIVGNIDEYEKNMFYESKVNDVLDPIQNARLALYKNYCAADGYIELIQPLNDSAFTMNALKKHGNHFNHFCYNVDTLDDLKTVAEVSRLIEILSPTPAILFDNKKVAFYYTRNRQVIEFLIRN